MRLTHYLRRALEVGPRETVRLARLMLRERLAADRTRKRDARRPTSSPPPPGPLARLFTPPPAEALAAWAPRLAELGRRTLEHRFDLLGSGWVQVRRGMECAGLEGVRFAPGPAAAPDPDGRWLEGRINPPNLGRSRELWRMVSPGYVPIDWQLDFKSGFRWFEAAWYKDIAYGRTPGADVKVPWELARMQHLPWLALAHGLSAAGCAGLPPAAELELEFRDQVLDFAACNPPRFGVNWACAMDAAIRGVNLLAAHDLFLGSGARFDPAFEAVFAALVLDHGRHVAANLEYNPTLRANHYLADVTGLLFLAAALPPTPETDAWLAFAARETARETLLQFHPDGTNFEASTSYHRLSLEMALYAWALLLGLPPGRRAALASYDHRRWTAPPALPPAPLDLPELLADPPALPGEALRRLERGAGFVLDYSGPDNAALQIGDNDSGRFLKLQPAFAAVSPEPDRPWREDHGDHRHLLAAAAGLLGRGDLLAAAGPQAYEHLLIAGLARREPPRPGPEPARRAATGLTDCPDFGLAFLRGERLEAAFRCGPVGQGGNGGHGHNDQLSLALWCDGRPFLSDPGTFVYTPLPGERNRFRSTAAHATLVAPGLEQNPFLAETLFALRDQARAARLPAPDGEVAGEHHGFGPAHVRRVRLSGDTLQVRDACALPGAFLAFPLHPEVRAELLPDRPGALLDNQGVRLVLESDAGQWRVEPGRHSRAYGRAEPCLRLRLEGFGTEVRWTARPAAAAEEGQA